MPDTAVFWRRFDEFPLVGILRRFPGTLVPEAVRVAHEAGLSSIEVTLNADDALPQIAALAREFGADMNVGAGTVTTLAQLDAALAAGARFIVCPVVVPDIIRRCKAEGIPVFPGAFTPTEIFQAWEAGADMVKLFPAGDIGAGYLKAVKAPLPQVRIMAVGGIGLAQVPDYRKAGAEGFGVGGPLFDKDRVMARDWPWLREQVRLFREALQGS